MRKRRRRTKENKRKTEGYQGSVGEMESTKADVRGGNEASMSTPTSGTFPCLL